MAYGKVRPIRKMTHSTLALLKAICTEMPFKTIKQIAFEHRTSKQNIHNWIKKLKREGAKIATRDTQLPVPRMQQGILNAFKRRNPQLFKEGSAVYFDRDNLILKLNETETMDLKSFLQIHNLQQNFEQGELPLPPLKNPRPPKFSPFDPFGKIF